jgi:hypothetical protein
MQKKCPHIGISLVELQVASTLRPAASTARLTGRFGWKRTYCGSKLKNGILLITGQDEIQFSMKLTRANEAELQIVIPAHEADQVPAPKPWKLERVKG